MDQQKLSNLPDAPGVYLFKDKNGKILYIGKAKSLHHRVKSHFSVSPRKGSEATSHFSSLIEDIDYVITNSDIEALILEANLVKLHLPKYNVRLKDDKKYPYIKITIKDKFPAVFPTRDLRDGNSIYFGPYTDAKNMRKALKTASHIFSVRTCKGKLPKKACLLYHIGKCSAPCENRITKEEYKKLVDTLIQFLSGKSEQIERQLVAEMKTLSENLEFEKAAKIRDRLNAVQEIVRKQSIVSQNKIDIDIFGIARASKICVCSLLIVREGKMLSAEHYTLDISSLKANPPLEEKGSEDGEIIRSFLIQYYKNVFYIPKRIVVSAVDEKRELEEWLGVLQNCKTPDKIIITRTKNQDFRRMRKSCKIIIPVGGTFQSRLLKLAEKNAKVRLEEKSPERIPLALKQLKRLLKLTKIPVRIEAFDISNISGKSACGSSVLFVNGRPQKSGYRRYKIKTVKGIDDYAMMKEIVRRRSGKWEVGSRKWDKVPDLILIDGGIGQVRAARQAINQFIPIFGLAKRFEELYLEDGRIVALPKDSLALRLLQRIRDEAHRFAITYHRKLRDNIKSKNQNIQSPKGHLIF